MAKKNKKEEDKKKHQSSSNQNTKNSEHLEKNEPEVIVTEKEIENTIEKENKKKQTKSESDSEPSWYHYASILAIILVVFGLLYIGFEIFYENSNPQLILNQNKTYTYPFKIGNVTYNIEFASPIEEVQNSNYPIEFDRMSILNTINFKMAFDNYSQNNGTDNGKVAQAASKLTSYLKNLYNMKFSTNSFVMLDELNCSNSTNRNKIITFSPYEQTAGAFMDENGCIEIKARNATEIMYVVDKIMLDLIKR